MPCAVKDIKPSGLAYITAGPISTIERLLRHACPLSILTADIASEGKESSYPKGWSERWRKTKEIQENTYLRSTKYYFFYAYEDLLNENTESFKENLYLMQESIESNNDFIGIDNHTKNFLKAYSNEIAEYYYRIQFMDGLVFLSNYDIDNKVLYQKFIAMLK